MAKRGAASELNHDNWDQEEESEEAGEFKKATDDQMKGRVIRKAKRRNLNDDQKKNVFAGFVGFTSSNIDAKSAFSFIGKATGETEAKAGFSFGSTTANKSSTTQSSGNRFSFGGSSNHSEAGNTPFSGFSFGQTVPANNVENVVAAKHEEVSDVKSKDNDEREKPNLAEENAHVGTASSESAISTNADAPPPVDDLFAKFMTKKSGGSWTCEVCMITNDASRDTCIACEAPRPGSKIEKSKSALPNPVVTSDAVAPPPVDDLFAKFMTKKSGGSWTCEVCMISNDASRDTCIACEAPRPGLKIEKPTAVTESTPSFSFGEGGGFKFGGDPAPSQTSNPLVGFKFGSSGLSDTQSTSAFSGGFKFGSSESTDKGSEIGGFKFGTSKESSKSAEQSSGFTCNSSESVEKGNEIGGFKFGVSQVSPKPSEQVSGLKFGSSEISEENGGIKFGQDLQTESSSGFKFGTGSTSGAMNDIFKSSEGAFKFSADEKAPSKFKVKACDTPKTKSKKSEYLADLKALNIQVTNWIKSHVDGNPLVDLTPVFQDYEKHLNEMRKKFNVQVSLRPAETETMKMKSERETNDKFCKDDKQSNGTASSEVEKDLKPFSFEGNKSAFGNIGSSAQCFQFGFLKKDDKAEEETKSEENDDQVPAKSVLEPVVECDALYSKKCKLFYKKEGAYVERGLGHIYLKHTEESKLQVIIRADTSLGNILLNIIMTEDIPIERVGKNNVMLICVPNPPIDPKSDPEPVTFLIRVKNSDDADELKNKLNELMKSVS